MDERGNQDAGWSKDGQSIYFSSNRKGNFDIFRKGINEITAQEAVTSPEDETSPQTESGRLVVVLPCLSTNAGLFFREAVPSDAENFESALK